MAFATGATGYGVLPQGFLAKPLTVIDDEIDAGLRAILGDTAGTSSDGKIPTQSMAGQLKALLVDGFAAQWDLLETVYASFDPNQATDAAQDAICAITGTVRQPARASVATGVAVGNPNTTLPANSAAVVPGVSTRFSLATGTAIATGVAFSASGTYGIGDLFYTPASRTYLCVASGAMSGASAPSGIGTFITAGAAKFRYLGDGIGYIGAPFICETIGAVGVATGSLSSISTPIDGWNAIYNPKSAVTGRLKETSSELRIRREQDLASAGNTTIDAIRSNILSVNEGSEDPAHEPVTSCSVFFNDTDVTDSNGVPPHAIEVLVQDGTDEDIAQAVWDSVGAGTRTYGNTSGTATDSEGNSQTVYYSRPTEIGIYVAATGKYLASEWPANSNATVAQSMLSALLTAVQNWPAGRDVRTSPLIAAMMRGGAGTTGGVAIVPAPEGSDPVPGLMEVESIYLGISGASGTSQVSIGTREIAVFDSSRCTITATTEDP